MNEIKKGDIYKHYKGKLYKVHGLAIHSEELEPYVYYECLYPNDMGQFWIRPLSIFSSNVHIDNVEVPRFVKVEKD